MEKVLFIELENLDKRNLFECFKKERKQTKDNKL